MRSMQPGRWVTESTAGQLCYLRTRFMPTDFRTCSRVAANGAVSAPHAAAALGTLPRLVRSAHPRQALLGEHPGVPAARTLRGGVARWGCLLRALGGVRGQDP